jgi:hypothetical protein
MMEAGLDALWAFVPDFDAKREAVSAVDGAMILVARVPRGDATFLWWTACRKRREVQ